MAVMSSCSTPGDSGATTSTISAAGSNCTSPALSNYSCSGATTTDTKTSHISIGCCNSYGHSTMIGSDCSHSSKSSSSMCATIANTSNINMSCSSSSPPAVAGGKVCRDFLRKVCRRGSRCKFVHVEGGSGESNEPPSPTSINGGGAVALSNGQQDCGTAVSATQGSTQLTFCHDYQNDHCNRNCCKFIHCTCEEENQYLQTGHIPPHVLDQAIRKGQMADATLNGDIPICKDYLMGECEKRRGGKCKFRHLNQAEYHQEIYGYSTLTPPLPSQPPPLRHPNHHQASVTPPAVPDHLMNGGATGRLEGDRGHRVPSNMYNTNNTNGHEGFVIGAGGPRPPMLLQAVMANGGMAPPEMKRPRLDPSLGGPAVMYHDFAPPRDYEFENRDYVHGLTQDEINRELLAGRSIPCMREFREPLSEWERRGLEMTVLRKQMENMKQEINALKKENSDLRATNDFLLDKVTSYGASKLNGLVSTSTSLPSVSLAQTLAAAASLPSLTASLSAAAAQVTPVSHPLTLGPALSMALPQQTIVHPTITAPPSITNPSIAQATECTVQAGVQHPLTNPLSITSISTDGSVGSVVARAAPPQPPPPSQPPPPPPPQPMAPPLAVAVAAAPPTAAVVVSVGTVQVPLSQAAITITSGTLNPRITTTSMSMTLPSIATAPSIGQAMAAAPGPAVVAAAANIAQAISMSQGGQAISMSQAGQAIAMSQGGSPISMTAAPISITAQPISMSAQPISMTAPPISMTAPPISMTAPPISMSAPPISMSASQAIISGAAAGQLLSYPIMSQPPLRTQLH